MQKYFNPKLGYYTVNDKIHLNKIAACVEATKLGTPVKWIFNDATFNAVDWTKEPIETLDQLYDARARELRAQYEYVIIAYSGGSDSHNLLSSFLRQGLHVDELYINHVHNGDKLNNGYDLISINNKDAAHSRTSEHLFQAMPMATKINQMYPNIKITYPDMTEHVFDEYKRYKDGNWVMAKSDWIHPVGGHRWDMTKISSYAKLFDQGKKTCIVFGIEKPRVGYQRSDNQFYLLLNDRPTTFGPAQYLREYHGNVEVEFFYWAPSCVNMIAKQAHTMKKYIESLNIPRSWRFPLDANAVANEHEPIMRNLLYGSTWNENFFSANRHVRDWSVQLDQWFFKVEPTNGVNLQQIWKEGTQYIIDNAEPYLKLYNNEPDGLKSLLKMYSLGPPIARPLWS